MALILDQFLATGARTEEVTSACTAVLLAFYFGWRSSTIAILSPSDVCYVPELNGFRFDEKFSKGAFVVRSF
jgi:hypothetical protein